MAGHTQAMSSHFRTQGIVLDKQDIGEADRIFTVFTRDFGKLQLRAVSARKITSKLRGGLELFYCSEIAFVQGKSFKTITDAAVIDRYPILRADIMGMRILNRLSEITDEMLRGEEKDERVWNLLSETLLLFNRHHMRSQDRNLAAYYFLWNLLYLTGYGLSFGSIAKRDEGIAHLVQEFVEKDAAALQDLAREGINERLLKEISQEHLSKVLES